jgi:hypothetical protein
MAMLALSNRTLAVRARARSKWRMKAFGPLKAGSLCKDLQ